MLWSVGLLRVGCDLVQNKKQNPHILQYINGKTNCGTSIQWNTTQQYKGMRYQISVIKRLGYQIMLYSHSKTLISKMDGYMDTVYTTFSLYCFVFSLTYVKVYYYYF